MATGMYYVQSHHNRGRGSAEENRVYVFSRQALFYCNPLDRPVWVETHCCVLFISAFGVPFEVDFGTERVTAEAVLAGPLLRRKVMARDAGLVGFYLMPESPLFAHLVNTLPPSGFRPVYRGRLDAVNDELIALYQGRASVEQTLQAAGYIQRLLSPGLATPGAIPSAGDLTASIRSDPAVSLQQLAQQHGVSYTRMSRVFSRNVGLSFREYKNWLKHMKVVRLMETGISLTEVAQEAGFADLAQFTRIYKRWYGNPPSYVRQQKNIRVFLAPDFTGPR